MENKDQHAKMLWIDGIAVIEPRLIILVEDPRKIHRRPARLLKVRSRNTLLIELKSLLYDGYIPLCTYTRGNARALRFLPPTRGTLLCILKSLV